MFLILLCIIYVKLNFILLIITFFSLGVFSSSQSLGYALVVNNNLASMSAVAASITSMLVLGGGAILSVIFGAMLDLSWNGAIKDSIPVYSTSDFNFGMRLLLFCILTSVVLACCSREER